MRRMMRILSIVCLVSLGAFFEGYAACKVITTVYLARSDYEGLVAELTISECRQKNKKIRKGVITKIIKCGNNCPVAITP